MTAMDLSLPQPSRAPGAALGQVLDSREAGELIAALRDADPMRAAFDAAVRRFVRAERRLERDLETILAALGRILRAHVEPGLDPARHRALRDAVTWFAVSEYHRAD